MPPTGTKRKRGQQAATDSLEYVLRAMYEDPSDQPFRNIKGSSGALTNVSQWAFDICFQSRNRAVKKKINTVFMVVDAAWTKEERERFINKEFTSELDAFRFCKTIAQRVRNIVHWMTLPLPTSPEPAGQMKDAVQGLANRIQKWEIYKNDTLEMYIPAWDKGGGIMADKTIPQMAEEQRQKIIRFSNNPYRNSGRGRGRGGRGGRGGR